MESGTVREVKMSLKKTVVCGRKSHVESTTYIIFALINASVSTPGTFVTEKRTVSTDLTRRTASLMKKKDKNALKDSLNVI